MQNKSVISLSFKPYAKVFASPACCFFVVLPINRSTLRCLFSQWLASCCQDTCFTIADNSVYRRSYRIRQQLANQRSFLTNQQTAPGNSMVMGLIQERFENFLGNLSVTKAMQSLYNEQQTWIQTTKASQTRTL